jgi:hypothetical protein
LLLLDEADACAARRAQQQRRIRNCLEKFFARASLGPGESDEGLIFGCVIGCPGRPSGKLASVTSHAAIQR